MQLPEWRSRGRLDERHGSAPMALWQMDLFNGPHLANGQVCKLLCGIDDGSWFATCAVLLADPHGPAIGRAFTASLKRHGAPTAALLYDSALHSRYSGTRHEMSPFTKACLDHGIATSGNAWDRPHDRPKTERWYFMLRDELLAVPRPFDSLHAAQAAIDDWVRAYNYSRLHPALGTVTPASRFNPALSQN